jgi:nitrite reductase (NADH) small subunit
MSAVLENRSTEVVLGPLTQIPPGEGREFHVRGHHIAVFHTRSGAVYATQALCPHRQGPLSDGLVGGRIVSCPLHAWKFDLATGATLNGDCGIGTYPVRLDVEGGIVVTINAQD